MQEVDEQIIAAITSLVKENVEVLGDLTRTAADGEHYMLYPPTCVCIAGAKNLSLYDMDERSCIHTCKSKKVTNTVLAFTITFK